METRVQFLIVVAFLSLGSLASAAVAPRGFAPLPPLGGQPTRLQIRVVTYTGGVHGKMIIELKNPTAERESFSAQGLYFVPVVPAEQAPQREGAAGPFEVASSPPSSRTSSTTVAAGSTLRLNLQTFCLDSHRASPTAEVRYRVARTRLPASIQASIERGAAGILRTHHGNLDAASGEIQNLVWQTRNRSWIVLEGERAGERGAPASQPADQGGLIQL